MQSLRKKILIVDDSEICRDTAKLILEESGFEVITLATPIGFTIHLMSIRPDISLVDVGMPALQGTQLVDIAGEAGAAEICPLILFSDRSPSELEKLAHKCGADGFICKAEVWPSIIGSILKFLSSPRPASDQDPNPFPSPYP